MSNRRLRRVLILQGPASWFPTYLAGALAEQGAEVTRILLCPGDWLFWRGGAETLHYRGTPEDWPAYVGAVLEERRITDLVCLGDGRRWHRDVINRLAGRRVRIHVIEQGYIRPACLTVERDGTGGNTRFPTEWEGIAALAARGGEATPVPYRASFAEFAAMDVAYNLVNLVFGRLTHPHYRPHALDGTLREWAGWLRKAWRWPCRRVAEMRANARIDTHEGPVFLMALQLETDFQIRHHGPPEGMKGALKRVIRSFARHAPMNALLVVKVHPLDNGWADWGRLVATTARRAGAGRRAVVLDGGALDQLLPRLAGLVTVNSTTGLTALRAGVPTYTLGKAIYDLPGLTHRGELADFWGRPRRPDPGGVDLLVRALMSSIQVPGNFDGEGARPGAEAMAAKILADPVY
ncbi:capsular biosynthesis protein [Rhodobacteraceae bacterium NNCM2]|nr:capsular biosynthesis protein [Coraliihabitans acroporae]